MVNATLNSKAYLNSLCTEETDRWTTTEETMMTAHTEMQIPDDVMRAARKAWRDAWNGPMGNESLVIARALMAEREKCARICDSKMYDFGCISGTEAQDFVTLCADLAAEIRSVDK